MTGNYFSPNAGDSIIVRLKIDRQGQTLAQITTKIAELSGILGAIDIVRPISKEGSIRDFSIYTNGPEHADKIVSTLRAIKGVDLIQHSDRTFLLHQGGKIEVTSKHALKTREDLSMAYTPGVGKVCSAIHKNPDDVYKLMQQLQRPDYGSIQPSIDPRTKRVEGIANMLQALGLARTPRDAFRMANKINTSKDAVREFLPGESYKLAQERGDKLGQGLAMIDMIPGASLLTAPVKVAKKAKGTTTLYHGSAKPIKNINSDQTLYMTENRKVADLYTDPGYSAAVKSKENFKNISPTIIKSEVKTDKLFDTRIPEHKKLFEKEFYGKYGNMSPLTKKGLPDWLETEDIADFIKDKKLPFKGVLVDEGGYYNELGKVVDRGIGYAIFDSSLLTNTKKIK